MAKVSVEALDVEGKRVVVRVDFNVPLAEQVNGSIAVTDDTRIRAALPTLDAITGRGGSAILLSHLGRPKAEIDPSLSLSPVADHLSTLTDAPVSFLAASTGLEVAEAAEHLEPGSILLLENTRFVEGEKMNDDTLGAFWADLGDYYVNDAFGTAHRAHASTEATARHADVAAMGLLLMREVEYLSKLLPGPASSLDRPFVAVIGGAKVSDKIGIIDSLLTSADQILIGGAMAYTFLSAKGIETGTSLIEEDRIELAANLMRDAGGKLVLPIDHVAGSEFRDDALRQACSPGIPENWIGLDIGPETVKMFTQIIQTAQTVVWNGPMGVFEMPNFAVGTIAVAKALAAATAGGALTIVGGGDSVAALNQSGLENSVSHVSTGGGAMLEFLEGKTLPGIDALSDLN